MVVKMSSAKTTKAKGKKKKSGGSSWMMKGKKAAEAMAEEEAKAEAAAEEAGKMWRFRINTDKLDDDFPITFLDGDLDDDGLLDIPRFYEHTVFWNGRFRQFNCTDTGAENSEPCPLCSESNKRDIVGVVTILDHTPYESRAGKVFVHRRKLFIMKRQTMKMLTKIAKKRGGLTGCTFEVTRTSDKDAAVGNVFEFLDKNSQEDLFAEFGDKDNPVEPANYEEEIPYFTADELIAMGIGKAVHKVGSETPPADSEAEHHM